MSVDLARASIILLAALGIAGCGSGGGAGTSTTRSTSAAPRNPLADRSFYVDTGNQAALQVREWRQNGRAKDAEALMALAGQPTAFWMTGDADASTRVPAITAAAARAGKTALLVAYYIPGRDCGQFSAGGAPSAAAYRDWIAKFASAIGSRAATVILEPDAVAQAVSGCVPRDQVPTRYELLREAVRRFAALPNTSVYLDAGNAGWISPVTKLVPALQRSGIAAADGFALNVSNFYDNDTTIRYGNELSRALGGAHFVMDTSRNGNGPYTKSDGAPNWCNPPGRAIGHVPTTRTGVSAVDAFLWIKVPGESDGDCRPGAPAAGGWWPDYALELARNAHR